MKTVKRIAWVAGLIFSTINVCMSASAQKEPIAGVVSASDMAAFARVLAEDPLGGKFPYNVRVVVYSNPNECLESDECKNSKLFLAVIGDGELPDYKVYDAGNAVRWEFVRWAEKPSQFFDDKRDSFIIELIKTVPCKPENCEGARTRRVPVKARVSLFGFDWMN
jgi:hypothetical protein